MNLCAFNRQSSYVSNFSQKAIQQTKLEELWNNLYLSNAKLEFNSHDFSNEWLSVGLTSVQGWRTHQEDSHLVDLSYANYSNSDELALFGVFDGHNGCEVAQYASQMLPEYIQRNKHFCREQYVRSLEQSFLEFDQSLLSEKCNQDLNNIRIQSERTNDPFAGGRRKPLPSPLVALNVGCTAVVALLTKSGTFYVSNIGDSRCVACIKGKIISMSKDHKPTDDIERRRIERAGCQVIKGRINHGLNLARAFGDHILKNNSRLTACEQAVSAFPDVTVCKEKIKPGDSFMILACDGIWNSMSSKEACTLVRKCLKKGTMPLSVICEQLVRRCVSPVRPINGQMGGDNMTCIIVRFD